MCKCVFLLSASSKPEPQDTFSLQLPLCMCLIITLQDAVGRSAIYFSVCLLCLPLHMKYSFSHHVSYVSCSASGVLNKEKLVIVCVFRAGGNHFASPCKTTRCVAIHVCYFLKPVSLHLIHHVTIFQGNLLRFASVALHGLNPVHFSYTKIIRKTLSQVKKKITPVTSSSQCWVGFRKPIFCVCKVSACWYTL